MKTFRFVSCSLITFALIFSPNIVFPKTGGASANPLPTNGIFNGPVGILFPGYPSAAGVNPAALPLSGNTTAIQFGYSPAQGNSPSDIFSGIAASSKNMGLGIGYFGQKYTDEIISGGFAGAGVKIDPVSVGLSVRDSDLSKSGGTAVDMGLIAGERNGFTFGFVMYNLNSSAQLDAGIGYGAGKKYNMELNVLLPPFNHMSGNPYTITAGGTLYAADIVGLSFKTSYYTVGNHYQHLIGATVWVSDVLSLFVQFTTPNTWTGGITATF